MTRYAPNTGNFATHCVTVAWIVASLGSERESLHPIVVLASRMFEYVPSALARL